MFEDELSQRFYRVALQYEKRAKEVGEEVLHQTAESLCTYAKSHAAAAQLNPETNKRSENNYQKLELLLKQAIVLLQEIDYHLEKKKSRSR